LDTQDTMIGAVIVLLVIFIYIIIGFGNAYLFRRKYLRNRDLSAIQRR
jgi:hypothetical protein